jgi:hypothetical protein
MKFNDVDFEYDEFETPASGLEITIELELPIPGEEVIIADKLLPDNYILKDANQEKQLDNIELERQRKEYQDSINLFKAK